MATFRKRSNSWQARVQIDGYPDQSSTFKSYADAVSWARNIESSMDSGLQVQPSKEHKKVLLSELLERYRREVTVHKKLPDVEGYRIDFWLKQPVANLTIYAVKSTHVAQWREARLSLGRSPNTLRLELTVLSNLFNVATNEWGYEGLSNPTVKVKLPRLPSGRLRRLEEDEYELIIQNSESLLLKYIVVIALETAMRRSEIAGIEWSHINFHNKTLLIAVTKNGEPREVPLSSLAIRLLKSINKVNERVFNITPHAISIAFGRACKRAKLNNLHFHDLRHEAISRLFEKGLSLPEVATISGHKTWTMLRRYTHLSAANIAIKLG